MTYDAQKLLNKLEQHLAEEFAELKNSVASDGDIYSLATFRALLEKIKELKKDPNCQPEATGFTPPFPMPPAPVPEYAQSGSTKPPALTLRFKLEIMDNFGGLKQHVTGYCTRELTLADVTEVSRNVLKLGKAEFAFIPRLQTLHDLT